MGNAEAFGQGITTPGENPTTTEGDFDFATLYNGASQAVAGAVADAVANNGDDGCNWGDVDGGPGQTSVGQQGVVLGTAFPWNFQFAEA